ncbi:MAG TPA: hypothetical protein VEC35_16125 [Noviherbaspirillum sp.]|nr:hypothetical protein [Noviherbaspirillum sp.]
MRQTSFATPYYLYGFRTPLRTFRVGDGLVGRLLRADAAHHLALARFAGEGLVGIAATVHGLRAGR